jgi:dihydroorotase
VIATDHAPHTKEEKQNKYKNAPSGGPLVQHAVVAMFDKFHEGKISVEKIVEKMAHNPAILFDVEKRGYLREGYYADLVVVDPDHPWTVEESNLLYKCGWSPFTGHTFKSKITHTFINGHLAYSNDVVSDMKFGKRLTFSR